MGITKQYSFDDELTILTLLKKIKFKIVEFIIKFLNFDRLITDEFEKFKNNILNELIKNKKNNTLEKIIKEKFNENKKLVEERHKKIEDLLKERLDKIKNDLNASINLTLKTFEIPTFLENKFNEERDKAFFSLTKEVKNILQIEIEKFNREKHNIENRVDEKINKNLENIDNKILKKWTSEEMVDNIVKRINSKQLK